MRGIVVADVTQGVTRVRAWPRPRGKAKTKAQREAQAKFAQAERATKFWDPRLYLDAYNATEGTPLLPRDLMTMIMFNRFAAFITEDGKVLWPTVAQMDVSEALDIISQTPGYTLVRGDEQWIALPYDPGGGSSIISLRAKRSANFSSLTNSVKRVNYDTLEFGAAAWFDAANNAFICPPECNRAEFTHNMGTSTGTNSTFNYAMVQRGTVAGSGEVIGQHGTNQSFWGTAGVSTGPVACAPGDKFIATIVTGTVVTWNAAGGVGRFAAKFWNEE